MNKHKKNEMHLLTQDDSWKEIDEEIEAMPGFSKTCGCDECVENREPAKLVICPRCGKEFLTNKPRPLQICYSCKEELRRNMWNGK